MSDFIRTKKAFEDRYYSEMSPDVEQHILDRNNGISLVHGFTHWDRDRGLQLLQNSVGGLEGADTPYSREYFASLYMYSRGLLLTGDFDSASSVAKDAIDAIPGVPDELSDQVIADQYTAIASGRLSMILSATDPSTFGEWQYVVPYEEAASKAAKLARQTCRFSENKERMLFANGTMSDSERLKARRRHELAAAAATVGLWLPGFGNRRKLARKFCA